MVQMGKVLVARQAFHPGNGKRVTRQLLCVLPAARAPRVATYTRAAAGGATKGYQGYVWYSRCVPELHRAVCKQAELEGAQRGSVTRGGRTGSSCRTGAACQHRIPCAETARPSGADGLAVCSVQHALRCSSRAEYGSPPALEYWKGAGVTWHWWVSRGRVCPWRHSLWDCSWHGRRRWDQHSSACAVTKLPGISARSIPADFWLLCSTSVGNSVSWLALLAFTASRAVLPHV